MPRVTNLDRAKNSDEPPSIDNDLVDFANLVVVLNRLLTVLTSFGPFKEANVGLSEWVVLCLIEQHTHVNGRQLAKALGVTRQRANQLKSSLENANLITATQSPNDARKKLIALTPGGRAQLASTNAELRQILSEKVKKNGRTITRTTKHLKILMKAIAPAVTIDKQATAEEPTTSNLNRAYRRFSW
jgi:DNA-binding MarR family transcriptional regulator